MPLFMDVHDIVGGVAIDDVAHAHLADLQAQAAHDVQYLGTGWTSGPAGCSAWSRPRPRTPLPRFTGRPTGWSPTTSTGSKKGPRGEGFQCEPNAL